VEPEAPEADGRAAAEASQLASGKTAEELARATAEREHARGQRFRDHFEWLAIGGMWAFAFVLLTIGGTWLWHLLTPDSWHWLDPEALSRVQNIFTGGVLAGVVADHFRKRLGRD
jgi:hypothetical protein